MPVFNWLQMGLGAIVAFGLSYMVATINDYRIEAQWREKLSAQVAADNKQCDSDKQLTKKANDEIVKNRNIIVAERDRLKRLYGTHCIVPASSKALLPGALPKYAGVGGAVTGTSDDFRDFNAECESIRKDYYSCKDSWK